MVLTTSACPFLPSHMSGSTAGGTGGTGGTQGTGGNILLQAMSARMERHRLGCGDPGAVGDVLGNGEAPHGARPTRPVRPDG